MDFETARKIADKLENNLNFLDLAIDFVKETHDSEDYFQDIATHGVFSTLKQSLIVYCHCEGDNNSLTKLIEEMSEIAKDPSLTPKPEYLSGNTLIELINHRHRFSGDKYLDFNEQADQIFKEIDAQVNILCNEYSIDKITGRHGSDPLPSEQWKIKHLKQAFNVVKAVKSLTD